MTTETKLDLSADQIRARLDGLTPLRLPPDGKRLAAVLIPIFLKDNEWHVLLTKRTDTVEHHKGEISFPGGHKEEEDADFEVTARRETCEEVGICEGDITVLGRMDDRFTITGFRIRPFVGLVPYPFTPKVNAHEIAELILLPLRRFVSPDRFVKREFRREGQPYPVYYFEVDGHNVWGATARMLKEFLELVFDVKYE